MNLEVCQISQVWRVGDVLLNGRKRAHVMRTYPCLMIWLEVGAMIKGTQQEMESLGWHLKPLNFVPLRQTIGSGQWNHVASVTRSPL